MLFKQKNLKASGVVFILSYVVFKSLRNWQFQIVEKIGRKKETYLRNTQTTNNYRALISWFIAWLSLNHDIIYLYGKPTLWHRKVHFEGKQTFHSLHYDNNVLAHNNSVILFSIITKRKKVELHDNEVKFPVRLHLFNQHPKALCLFIPIYDVFMYLILSFNLKRVVYTLKNLNTIEYYNPKQVKMEFQRVKNKMH